VIGGEHEPWLGALVEDGDRVHAVQVLGEAVAVHVVQRREDRPVAAIGKGVTPRAQPLSKLVVVVNLSVEDDSYSTVQKLVRLLAAVQIHNGQPVVPDGPHRVVHAALAIGATVPLKRADRLKFARGHRAIKVTKYPTHRPTLACVN
jgi:hypothetical protein